MIESVYRKTALTRKVAPVLTEEKKELYALFAALSTKKLEELLLSAQTHEERVFYRTLLNLKLQLSREKIVGKALL